MFAVSLAHRVRVPRQNCVETLTGLTLFAVGRVEKLHFLEVHLGLQLA